MENCETPPEAPVTICVLTSGDYAHLAKRAVASILQNIERRDYRLIVAANGAGCATRDYLNELYRDGRIDELIVSHSNLGKCPMMRRIFDKSRSEFIWWFDEDSYVISSDALKKRLKIARAASADVVMWGERYMCDDPGAFSRGDAIRFVRTAPWYRGFTPPFRAPGGKGEFNFDGQGTGDARWIFIHGANWFIRASAVVELGWPDPRLRTFGDDVFLGEAIRQQGWEIQHIGSLGVIKNAAPRRWSLDEEFAQAASGSDPCDAPLFAGHR